MKIKAIELERQRHRHRHKKKDIDTENANMTERDIERQEMIDFILSLLPLFDHFSIYFMFQIVWS